MCWLWFSFLYSPAYPLGTRLGQTCYWVPAVFQETLFISTFRQGLVVTQWLLLWFYAQRTYLMGVNLVDDRSDVFLLGLLYLSVLRVHWQRRRVFRRRKRRYYVRAVFKRLVPGQGRLGRGGVPTLLRQLFWSETTESLGQGMFARFFRGWRAFSQRVKGGGCSFVARWSRFLQGHFWRLKRLQKNILIRFFQGRLVRRAGEQLVPYSRPRVVWRRGRVLLTRFGVAGVSRFFYRVALKGSWHRRRWLFRFIRRRREYYKKFLYSRFKRLAVSVRVPLSAVRFFWYLKVCLERYFCRFISLQSLNLYQLYFQSTAAARLVVGERTLMRRYTRSIHQRRRVFVTRFRQQAHDYSFRPSVPITNNKYTYAQLVLFLQQAPLWRKLVNTFVLCYLVIVSALLKNINMLSQWLYNMVSLGHTRRFRLLRMRFFACASKLLRDYGVFGKHLRGFRLEVYGKTGRSQKTRTRFFGDAFGLKFYNLGFRMKYQAFDIPTFAGVLGIHFWAF